MKKDVNGNPLKIDKDTYRQMRERIPSHDSVARQGRGGSASHNDEMGNKSDDAVSPPGATANGGSDRRKSRKQSRKAEKAVYPDKEPNYVGNVADVESLAKFINSEVSEKTLLKGIKKTNGGGNGTAAAANNSDPLGNKAGGKKKDRNKTKQYLTAGVGDNCVEASITPASEATQLLSSSSSSKSTHSIDSCAGKPDEKAVHEGLDAPVSKEMGSNQSTSSDQPEEKTDSVQPLKNHKVHEKAKPVADTKSDVVSNHKNHVLPHAKSPPASKKEQAVGGGEMKEAKGKGVKGACKDKSGTGSSDDAASSTDTPTSTKKAKAKTGKSEAKTDNAGQKRASDDEGEKEGKYDSNSKDKKAKMSVKVPEVTSVKVQEVMSVKVQEVISPPPSSPGDNSNNLDFTDFEMFDLSAEVNEIEFQTVKSKKNTKKKTQQVSNSSQQSSYNQHNYAWKDKFSSSQPSSTVPYNRSDRGNGGWQQQRGGEAGSNKRYNQSKARSFTPPPTKPVVAESVVSKDSDPLNPSAFPDLPTHDRQRRRSLEDVSLDTGQFLPSDKDSDKESCKSLPADKGFGARTLPAWSGAGRQAPAVTYAVMASSAKTPRQSVDSSKAESVSSGSDDQQDYSPTAQATTSLKWKGAPQERRHSIGSAPEELAKLQATGGMQRTGSQELLPREVDNDKGVKVSPKGMTPSDSACSFAGSDVDSARGSEGGSETTNDVFPSLPSAGAEERKGLIPSDERKPKTQAAPVVKCTIPDVSSSVSTQAIGNRPGTVQAGATKPTSASASIKTVSQRNQPLASTASSSRSQTTSTTSSRTDVSKKPTNNGLKGAKKGGVEFLDCKENVPSLNISFFYDPNCGGVGEEENPVVADAVSVNIVQARVVGAVTAQASMDQPAMSSRSVGVTASSQSLPSSSSASDNKSTKPVKGPHIAGLNGLVQPLCSDVKARAVSDPPAAVPPATSGPAVMPVASGDAATCAQGEPAQPAARVLPTGAMEVLIGGKVQMDGFQPLTKVFLPSHLPSSESQATIDCAKFLAAGWKEPVKYLEL